MHILNEGVIKYNMLFRDVEKFEDEILQNDSIPDATKIKFMRILKGRGVEFPIYIADIFTVIYFSLLTVYSLLFNQVLFAGIILIFMAMFLYICVISIQSYWQGLIAKTVQN